MLYEITDEEYCDPIVYFTYFLLLKEANMKAYTANFKQYEWQFAAC